MHQDLYSFNEVDDFSGLALLYKDHQFSGTTVDGRNPANHQGCIEPCE